MSPRTASRQELLRSRPDRRRGFSLSECLLSLLILSLLSVVLVGVVPATLFGLKSASNRAQATCMARELLDGLYSCGGDEGSTTLPIRTVHGTDYTIFINVGPVTGLPGPPLEPSVIQRVTIAVTWEERGVKKAHTLSTWCWRP